MGLLTVDEYLAPLEGLDIREIAPTSSKLPSDSIC
jgi:hypothetical protein